MLDLAEIKLYKVPKSGIYMRLLGINKIRDISGLDSALDRWLVSLINEIRSANWHTRQDVLEQFPRSNHTEDRHIDFHFGETNAGLRTLVDYGRGIVLVIAVIGGTRN